MFYLRQSDFQPLSTLLELFLHHPPLARAWGLLPFPCQPHQLHACAADPSQAPSFAFVFVHFCPGFFLDPSSSSLGAFGILILLSNVSADPLRLLTDGNLIIVPSTPSSSLLRSRLEQAEQCRPLHRSLWTGIYCTSLEARGKLRPIFPCLEMCFGRLNTPGE